MVDPGRVYDVCVVGAGIIGTAAARHLSEGNPALSVLLVGPIFREDRTSTDIHGAHHDEGRLARVIDENDIWATLGRRAMSRYRQLEARTGISLYNEVGYLIIADKDGEYMKIFSDMIQKAGVDGTKYSIDEMKSLFPYLSITPPNEGLYTKKRAGYISPKNCVIIQKTLAQRAGCCYKDDVIASINMADNQKYHVLKTDLGQTYHAKKVLIATGAFTNSRNLLPRGMVPKWNLIPFAVLLVEIREEDLDQVKNMPGLCTRGDEGPQGPTKYEMYALPPIKYPDGKYYLKVGHGLIEGRSLKTPSEVHNWYCRQDKGYLEEWLLNITKKYFSNLRMDNYRFDYCVVAETATGFPYIDMVGDSLGVAIGGCARAAKCGDEIGKVAARMIERGSWDYDLPASHFTLQCQQVSNL